MLFLAILRVHAIIPDALGLWIFISRHRLTRAVGDWKGTGDSFDGSPPEGSPDRGHENDCQGAGDPQTERVEYDGLLVRCALEISVHA